MSMHDCACNVDYYRHIVTVECACDSPSDFIKVEFPAIAVASTMLFLHQSHHHTPTPRDTDSSAEITSNGNVVSYFHPLETISIVPVF